MKADAGIAGFVERGGLSSGTNLECPVGKITDPLVIDRKESNNIPITVGSIELNRWTNFCYVYALSLDHDKESLMPLKHPASKHHMDAAERHHEAAKHHHSAAVHHEAGDHDKAKEHSNRAREHGNAAVEHGKKGHEESHK